MIQNLRLKNFKSHRNSTIEFRNLLLLCGANAVGKSSVSQALLLLRETYLANSNFEYLDLKSNPINIGTAKDAIYQFAPENILSFEVTTDSNSLHYSFEAKDSELGKTLMRKPKDVEHVSDKDILCQENLFDKHCQFISAARLGPQPIYIKDDVVVDIYNQISVLEGRAEHFVHYLMTNKDKDVLPELRNPNTTATDLFYQVTAWEKEISSGVNIIVEDLGQLGYELTYQFSTESNEGKTSPFRSSNVGFGLSYSMPILVAILSAPKGALIIIENPEAHIHPAGQAKLAELICLAAQAGIQMIVETHSDHIINGVLVQCKKAEENEKGINKDLVSIYHFNRNEKEHSSVPMAINIEDQGRIRFAPQGFFDQFTIDREFLLGF